MMCCCLSEVVCYLILRPDCETFFQESAERAYTKKAGGRSGKGKLLSKMLVLNVLKKSGWTLNE